MILLLALAVSPGPSAPAPIPAAAGQEPRAFVELVTAGDTFHWREPIRVTVRFGLDAEFFAEQALPLFLQDFDLPVQLQVPWAGGLPAVRDLGPAAAREGGQPDAGGDEPPPLRLALGDGPATAAPAGERDVDGRRHDLYEVAFDIVPARSGTLDLPAPTLRYAWTTGFRDDLLTDRVPLDHHETNVVGEALVLTILPLPEEGRPASFVDAVGPLAPPTLAVSPRTLAPGEVLTLTLGFEGRGALDAFTPPDLERLPGFHFLSREMRPPADVPSTSRTLVYELTPANPQVVAVPAVEFAWFDTTPPAGYRVQRLGPVPLELTPRAAAADGAPRSPPERAPATARPGAGPAEDDGPGTRVARLDGPGRDGDALRPPRPPLPPPTEPTGNVALLIGLGLLVLAPAVVAGVTMIRRHRARRRAQAS